MKPLSNNSWYNLLKRKKRVENKISTTKNEREAAKAFYIYKS